MEVHGVQLVEAPAGVVLECQGGSWLRVMGVLILPVEAIRLRPPVWRCQKACRLQFWCCGPIQDMSVLAIERLVAAGLGWSGDGMGWDGITFSAIYSNGVP